MQVRPVSKTVIWLAVGMVLFAMLPALTGFLDSKGQWFLPYGYSFDDQMVYQAWIHQAAEGNWRFSNRFTFDSDPGLTINLFFLVLGQIAKLAGGVGADLLARGVGTALLVLALYRLIFRFSPNSSSRKSAMIFSVLGGGFGALVWHHYGRGVVRSSPLGSLLGPGLPVDVWQPEIFVFPSMLTTSLFVVSLALVVTAFVSVIDAAEQPKWPLAGTLSMAVLMNIHSYDVLIIGLVLLGLLVMLIAGKSFTSAYLVRVLQICAGILPAALYYVYVIKNDPVFAARAATPTYTSSFREMAFGLAPLLVMGCVWVGQRVGRYQALSLAGALMLAAALAQPSAEAFGLSPITWSLVLVGVLAWLGWSGQELSLVEKLILAWAVMGLLAPYFPALFQRKLAAGLAIPWGILAGDALVRLYQMKGNGRPFAALGLAGMFVGVVGMWNWLSREMVYIRGNVSRTTVNSLAYPMELKNFVSELAKHPGTKIVAPPGVPNSVGIDEFATPLITDFNPLFTGMAGARTYAGHWSETPDYLARRNESAAIFFVQTSDVAVREFLDRTQPNYLCAPTGNEVFRDFSDYGDTVATAPGWVLIRLR